MVSQFMLIVNRKYILAVCDENEEVVACGFCLPSISKAVQKSGGRLTPATIIKLLKAIKNPEIIVRCEIRENEAFIHAENTKNGNSDGIRVFKQT